VKFLQKKYNYHLKLTDYFSHYFSLQVATELLIIKTDFILKYRFIYKEAKSWGRCLPDGSCTGAIGMLMNNDVDFAATEFMMTSDRLDTISFTTPIYTTKYISIF